MTALAFWALIINLTFDTIGQLSLKAAAIGSLEHSGLAHWKDMAKKPWLWVGLAAYTAEFIFWIAVLAILELSVGVMLISFNMVIIMIAGRILFKERITKKRLIGISLISIGVFVVGFGSL